MTSRLKHKLEIENINLKSAYLNESFVYIGTPLPALAETRKDKLEYVPEWQQEVRDEKGRRRFHGAFTGGWSAGYGNTVGSKEGWAPSTFKSSRNNRASASQRAEDFMDEEDLQQMNEDRKLENTDTFRNEGFAGTREELANRGASALDSLIAPAQTSIGQKLLTKLGWRPGQGIGPRVSLRKLRIQEGKIGRLGTEVSGEDLEDPEAGKHTFAPRDTKLLVFEGKDDRQGLGYERGGGMGRLQGSSSRAAAFGAARRPEMDEDEDPYAEASGSSQRFIIDQDDDIGDVIMVGGRDAPSRSGDVAQSSNQGDRWHDGRPILPGFTLDPKGVPPDKWFEMPEIPPDWRPRPARVWGTTRRWDETPGTVTEEKVVVRGAPGKPLTFEERGTALGEEQRISKAKSVFEYMSEKDRERLASLAASAKVAAPLPLVMDETEPEVEARPPAEEVVIPPLSPRTASAALKGFIPYGDDLDKQDRYRSYLSSQTLHTTQPDPILRSGTFDEINKELEDFASSARIFKPMSFAMSSRFTSGSTSLAASDMKQAKPGLHMYDAVKAKAEAEKPKVAEVEIKKALTPREQAAANGMYGQMTRVVKEFYPIKLLCKRFGVTNPHPEGDPGKGSSNAGPSGNDLEDTPLPSNDASWEDRFIHQESSAQPTEQAANEERRPRTIGEVGMADDVNQGRETLSYTKPNIDIFKAIFASDDEDDGDEDETPAASASVSAVPREAEGTATKRADPFPVKPEGPVDLAVFKPVFSLKKEEAAGESKEERKKAKKEKKKRKGVLSFDVGEDGDEDEEPRQKDEKKRKKHKENGSVAEQKDETEEWVEKPEIKPRLVGRKGAADFM